MMLTWWLQVRLTRAPSMLTISGEHGATSHKWSYIDHIKDHSAGNNIQIRVGETVKLSGALVASKS